MKSPNLVILGIIGAVVYLFTRKKTTQGSNGEPPEPPPPEKTIALEAGSSQFVYPGPTASVKSALNNIGPRGENVVVVIAKTPFPKSGIWRGFIPYENGNLDVMHEGYEYLITVQRDIVWELLSEE